GRGEVAAVDGGDGGQEVVPGGLGVQVGGVDTGDVHEALGLRGRAATEEGDAVQLLGDGLGQRLADDRAQVGGAVLDDLPRGLHEDGERPGGEGHGAEDGGVLGDRGGLVAPGRGRVLVQGGQLVRGRRGGDDEGASLHDSGGGADGVEDGRAQGDRDKVATGGRGALVLSPDRSEEHT